MVDCVFLVVVDVVGTADGVTAADAGASLAATAGTPAFAGRGSGVDARTISDGGGLLLGGARRRGVDISSL